MPTYIIHVYADGVFNPFIELEADDPEMALCIANEWANNGCKTFLTIETK